MDLLNKPLLLLLLFSLAPLSSPETKHTTRAKRYSVESPVSDHGRLRGVVA